MGSSVGSPTNYSGTAAHSVCSEAFGWIHTGVLTALQHWLRVNILLTWALFTLCRTGPTSQQVGRWEDSWWSWYSLLFGLLCFPLRFENYIDVSDWWPKKWQAQCLYNIWVWSLLWVKNSIVFYSSTVYSCTVAASFIYVADWTLTPAVYILFVFPVPFSHLFTFETFRLDLR